MRRCRYLCVAAATAAAVSSSSLQAQIASALMREGDMIAPGVTASGPDSPAVNGIGGWAFVHGNSDALDRFFGNATGGAGAVMFTEGTFGTFTQTGFEAFFGLADNGSLGYSPTVNDGAFTGLDCAWMDSTKILNERDPMPTLPGQFSTFNSDVQMTYNGIPYWVGGYSNAAGGATQNRALLKGTGANVVLQGGDMIPAAGAPMSMTLTAFGARMSALGTNYIYQPQLAAPATSTNDGVVVVNGDALMVGGGIVREGSPVPAAVGGLPGENWAFFDALAINEAGGVFFTGDTSAATTVDEFVFVQNAIVLREGTAVNTTQGPGVINGAIEWGDANETLDWAVTWDVDVAAVNREALFVNGQAVLVEGDLVDWNGDGVINAMDNNGRLADFTGIRAVAVGERMFDPMGTPFFDVYFTADIDFLGTPSTTDDLEGGFRYTFIVPEPSALSLLAAAGLLMLRRRRG